MHKSDTASQACMSHIPHPPMSPPAPTPHAPRPQCRQTRRSALTRHSHHYPLACASALHPHDYPSRQRLPPRPLCCRPRPPRMRPSFPRLPAQPMPWPSIPTITRPANALAFHLRDYPSRQRLTPRPTMLPTTLTTHAPVIPPTTTRSVYALAFHPHHYPPSQCLGLPYPRLPVPATPPPTPPYAAGHAHTTHAPVIPTTTRSVYAFAFHPHHYPPSQCLGLPFLLLPAQPVHPPTPPYAADCACLCLCLSFPLPPVPSPLSSYISMTACPAAAFTTDPFAGQCCLCYCFFDADSGVYTCCSCFLVIAQLCCLILPAGRCIYAFLAPLLGFRLV